MFAAGGWENIHVTTEEVEVSGSAPLLITAGDGTVLKNQKDVNEYFDGKIKELQELEQYDDADLQAALLQETFSRQQGDVDLQIQIDALEIPDAQEPLRYVIQTDKILRSTAEDPDPLVPVYAGPAAIELVDSEGFFSNVIGSIGANGVMNSFIVNKSL